MNDLKSEILSELENTRFPKCSTRKNVSNTTTEAFVLGDVNYRGQKLLNYRTRGPSRYNKKYTKLYRLLRKFMRVAKPHFKYTTIQVNKNVECIPHIDKNNVGPSYIMALGEYSGGELCIEGKEYNIKNKIKKFDGRRAHWTNPFEGTRYAMVFFTHTFKPPNAVLRNIVVTKDGIFHK